MPIEDGAFIMITVGLHAFHLAQGCEGKNVIIVRGRDDWPVGATVRAGTGRAKRNGD